MSIALICASVGASASGFALGRAMVKVPFPEKWVWFVGFGMLFAHLLANALYQYGSYFVILLPVLPILSNALQTTGTLALLVGAYSAINKASISAHWYSLPTGSAPMAMLAQYMPTFYFQIGLTAIFLAYVFVKQPEGKTWVVPFGLLVAASLVTNVAAIPEIPILGKDELHMVLQGAAAFLMAFMATGDGVTIGKTKIL